MRKTRRCDKVRDVTSNDKLGGELLVEALGVLVDMRKLRVEIEGIFREAGKWLERYDREYDNNNEYSDGDKYEHGYGYGYTKLEEEGRGYVERFRGYFKKLVGIEERYKDLRIRVNEYYGREVLSDLGDDLSDMIKEVLEGMEESIDLRDEGIDGADWWKGV